MKKVSSRVFDGHRVDSQTDVVFLNRWTLAFDGFSRRQSARYKRVWTSGK